MISDIISIFMCLRNITDYYSEYELGSIGTAGKLAESLTMGPSLKVFHEVAWL